MSTRAYFKWAMMAFTAFLVGFGFLLYKGQRYTGVLVQRNSALPDKTQHTAQRETEKTFASDDAWMKYLAFLPDRIGFCEQLFDKINKSDPFPESYNLLIQEHKEVLKNVKVTEGYSFAYLEEAMVMYELAKLPFVRTVCETGFNAGHSTLAWLVAKPDMQVFSFDIGQHPYAKDIAKWLASKFSDRFTITWGNSIKTLPTFRTERTEVKCDLIIVDGGHTYDPALSDFVNFYEMASADSVVLFDNYPEPSRPKFMIELGAVWAKQKRTGRVSEIFNCIYKRNQHGFSVGRFIK